MNRRERVRVYDQIYTNRGDRGDPCAYCGQVSDTMDHIPPLFMIEMARSAEFDIGRTLVKVPSCSECNSTLGSVAKLTIKDRRAHVRDHLRRKYASFLRIPNWDEDELQELSADFAAEVRASVGFANHVRARLAWMR